VDAITQKRDVANIRSAAFSSDNLAKHRLLLRRTSALSAAEIPRFGVLASILGGRHTHIEALCEPGRALPSERHRRRLRSDGCEKRQRRAARALDLGTPGTREAERRAGGASGALGGHVRRQPHVSGHPSVTKGLKAFMEN
jgi:hypothetical protein